MSRRNQTDAPSSSEIRNSGAIPFASQIPNDSEAEGDTLKDVLDNAGEMVKVLVEDIDLVTLNDEQSAAIGGIASKQFVPVTAVAICTGVGGTLAGDAEVTIGITSGGTQILAATALGLTTLNDKKIVDLSAVKKAAMGGNASVYVKVTKADTTGTAGSLTNVYLFGYMIPTAS
jgi:hypothetical protein